MIQEPLPAERREVWRCESASTPSHWAWPEVDARRIGRVNIYQASRQAMSQALTLLKITPDYLLLDAMRLDELIEQKPLIHGDARSVSIAAASILAKVERDRLMLEWDQVYPHIWLAAAQRICHSRSSAALRLHAPRRTIDFPSLRCGTLPAGPRAQRRLLCRLHEAKYGGPPPMCRRVPALPNPMITAPNAFQSVALTWVFTTC